MPGKVNALLAKLGIELPEPTPAWANYLSHVTSGNLVFVSGQLSQLGRAARICAINLLSHLRAACSGDLDGVLRCIEVGGFVNSGETGRHTRFAVGVAAIPFNFAVEVKAVFEVSR